ncbi:MAG: hypothetical protein L3J04_08840 [Robiginitomaculum sp.]|nr:hypothetical protein [Robiginitomaculum sp.]
MLFIDFQPRVAIRACQHQITLMTATPLEEYLEYYKELKEPPGFAVLVTGE